MFSSKIQNGVAAVNAQMNYFEEKATQEFESAQSHFDQKIEQLA
jgi:hypothetical protein